MKDASTIAPVESSIVEIFAEGQFQRLSIDEYDYPNPAYRYGVFKLGEVEIGCADKVSGGWTLRGGRKARSVRDAAIAMLRASVSDAQARRAKAVADEERARLMLRAVLKPEAVPVAAS